MSIQSPGETTLATLSLSIKSMQKSSQRRHKFSRTGSRPRALEEEVLPGIGLGFQRAASVHEVGKGLECRGRRAELQLVWRLRIHHLDHGFHPALLRLVLIVDFCRFFRVFRDELHGLVE